MKNSRGHTLLGSEWSPVQVGADGVHIQQEGVLPCVIYCHGNSSCRIDVLHNGILVRRHMVPARAPYPPATPNPSPTPSTPRKQPTTIPPPASVPRQDCVASLRCVSVIAFDCSGSGRSDGEYVTLGAHEQYDLEAVIEWALSRGRRRIAAWVRGKFVSTAGSPTLLRAPDPWKPPTLTQTPGADATPGLEHGRVDRFALLAQMCRVRAQRAGTRQLLRLVLAASARPFGGYKRTESYERRRGGG